MGLLALTLAAKPAKLTRDQKLALKMRAKGAPDVADRTWGSYDDYYYSGSDWTFGLYDYDESSCYDYWIGDGMLLEFLTEMFLK